MRTNTIHVVQRLAPGGIETLVLDLLRKGDGSDKVISLEGTREELIAKWPALNDIAAQLIALDRPPGLRPKLVEDLRKLFRHEKPRAIYAHHIGPLIYACPAARLAGVPGVVHVEHDAWHYEQPRRKRLAQALEATTRPKHVAVSQEIADKLARFLPAARITVIPNGVDLDRFRPGDKAQARAALGLPSHARVVGTAGRLVAVKAQADLITALKYLPDDVVVVLVGDGEERQALEAHADALGYSDRVVMLGHRDNLHEILPAFDVFALPSLNEGLPRSVIEAQACGVRVVASDVGAMRQAVCARTGRFVPPGQPEQLAAALLEALEQPPAVSPRAFVEANYSFAETLRAYRAVGGLETGSDR